MLKKCIKRTVNNPLFCSPFNEITTYPLYIFFYFLKLCNPSAIICYVFIMRLSLIYIFLEVFSFFSTAFYDSYAILYKFWINCIVLTRFNSSFMLPKFYLKFNFLFRVWKLFFLFDHENLAEIWFFLCEWALVLLGVIDSMSTLKGSESFIESCSMIHSSCESFEQIQRSSLRNVHSYSTPPLGLSSVIDTALSHQRT